MASSSGSEDDDPQREGRAYNQSIYLMVGMPYLLLGIFGLLIYRGYRKGQAAKQAGGGQHLDGPGGPSPCPANSHAEVSWPAP